jgi:RND superfamily putative drug exporter
MAPGLGFGILLDATIIRSLLLPATVSLFGWNWYLPTGLARILRVQPSRAVPPAPAPAPVPMDAAAGRPTP